MSSKTKLYEDKILVRYFTTLLMEILERLSIIEKSLVNGISATEWKIANVSPIFKKGSKNLAEK